MYANLPPAIPIEMHWTNAIAEMHQTLPASCQAHITLHRPQPNRDKVKRCIQSQSPMQSPLSCTVSSPAALVTIFPSCRDPLSSMCVCVLHRWAIIFNARHPVVFILRRHTHHGSAIVFRSEVCYWSLRSLPVGRSALCGAFSFCATPGTSFSSPFVFAFPNLDACPSKRDGWLRAFSRELRFLLSRVPLCHRVPGALPTRCWPIGKGPLSAQAAQSGHAISPHTRCSIAQWGPGHERTARVWSVAIRRWNINHSHRESRMKLNHSSFRWMDELFIGIRCIPYYHNPPFPLS